MKTKFLIALFFISGALQAQTINLVSDHKSSYRIIISKTASHWDSLAASELQKYVFEISGAKLPILNDDAHPLDHEILIGVNTHSQRWDLSAVHDEDGYVIRTLNKKLFLAGGARRGSLNAVYSFLEKYLDCRMYSSKVKIIPKKESIALPQINITENPVFSYRETYYYDAAIDEYAHWHKLTDTRDRKTWGMFVHTFQELLPPEKYFKDHPEYFAVRNGIRVPDEPCLANPDVYKIMTDELRKRMKENPQAKIWSVSQNDNFSCCTCGECSALDSLEGSPSASVISFVNKVAREFPDKIISTLAYQYSRKAPKTLKPEKNVNIMLCTIECYRTYPLEADTSEGAFLNDIKAWSKISNNILVWDYVVQFTNYICPFPNFHVLQPNIQLFAKYGAKMMFQQGAGLVNEGAEFKELRTYLISKLLWNPYINFDSVMNDFLNGYYGAAGKHIKEYIGLMKDGLIESNGKLWIYSNPVDEMNNYLSPALMSGYNKIFDEAEEAVKDNPVIAERVKIARLPLKYAMLEQAKVIGIGDRGTIVKSGDGYMPNHMITTMLAEFARETKLPGISYINEKNLSVDEYIRRYDVMLSKTMQNPLGLFKPAQFLTEPNFNYRANGYKSLTDGLRGDEDHHFNWLGYKGSDMEVVIDLEKIVPVKKVSADFLQINPSWIFLPEQFEVSLSEDGKNFGDVKIIKNPEPLTREDTFIHNFTAEFDSVNARYIKVKAVSIKDCPRWHTGYPFKAWIFTDEIVVE